MTGEVTRWQGVPDATERAIGMPLEPGPEIGLLVGEEDVMRVAAAWSVNPSRADPHRAALTLTELGGARSRRPVIVRHMARKARDASTGKGGSPEAAPEPLPVEEPPAESAPVAEAVEEEPPVEFENRAARRAKGKHTSGQHPVSGKGAHLSGRGGAVPGQRQWGSRRSG